MSDRTRLILVSAAIAGLFLQACGPGLTTHRSDEDIRVHQVELSISNIYIVETDEGAIMVDAGDVDEAEDILGAVDDLEIDRDTIGLIIITHAHADHTGSALELAEQLQIPVAIQSGDAPLLLTGENPHLEPTGFTARRLKRFLTHEYPAYEADIVFESCLDLSEYGVPAIAHSTPGHTSGSSIIVLADGDALVGDLMAGGFLGGGLRPHSPKEHYYQDDRDRVRAVITWLVESPADRLYLGHGGPVDIDRVARALEKGQFGESEGQEQTFSPLRCP